MWCLNEILDFKTLKFDLCHKIGTFDFKKPWPKNNLHKNWGIKRSSHLIHQLYLMSKTHTTRLLRLQNLTSATNDLKWPEVTSTDRNFYPDLGLKLMLITIISCKEPATKNLSDLRAASDLRDLNIWYLNEFPNSQTVKFDFWHKMDAIDLQWPSVTSSSLTSASIWPQKYAHDNWGTKRSAKS